MSRKEILIMYLMGFILGIMILTALDDILHAAMKMKINVAFPSASGSVIEGEATPA